jgi:hypothetical protein
MTQEAQGSRLMGLCISNISFVEENINELEINTGHRTRDK